MKFVVLGTFLLLFAFVKVQAQSEGTYPTSRGEDYYRKSLTEENYTQKKNKKKSKRKKSSMAEEFDQKIDEYNDRMEANARKYKKMSKEANKPQYSDPSYFGHKKPPKKRPPGKKKFCKECQIWH